MADRRGAKNRSRIQGKGSKREIALNGLFSIIVSSLLLEWGPQGPWGLFKDRDWLGQSLGLGV
jgi:hypothetical protein